MTKSEVEETLKSFSYLDETSIKELTEVIHAGPTDIELICSICGLILASPCSQHPEDGIEFHT